MRMRLLLVPVPALLLLGPWLAAAEPPAPAPAELAAVADAAAPSLVRVEYTLRYDKGEEPRVEGADAHGSPYGGGMGRAAELIDEERPLELQGFLISPTQVIAPDPAIHPRFVEGLAVRFGGDLVKARAAGYAKDRGAVLLELERPLKGARPLAFDARRKPPYLVVTYTDMEESWEIGVEAWPTAVSVAEGNDRFIALPPYCLVVDAAGAAVGLAMGDRLPLDDSWKGPPQGWPFYSADEMARMLADLQKRVDAAVLRVTLHFRSPRKEAAAPFRPDDEEESATETHVSGLLVSGERVLVLANLKPKVTARLERIVVRPAEGEPVTARFVCSLADYGCLVAALDKPLPGAVAFSTRPIREFRQVLLPAADVRLHGENRSVYLGHRRLAAFRLGWRRQVYPDMLGGEPQSVVLFDPQGNLVAMPVARREKVSGQERAYGAEPALTAAADFKGVLDDLAKHVDAHNVPLTEQEEGRLAWLGVELQGLNKELARANKVADRTRDGETGAMVSLVYPDSPAAKAGIQPGFILLRLLVEGRPKPLEIQLHREDDEGPFPWDQLDEVPEQYFERVPQPWPAAENAFTRALTDLGFGTKFKAEFFHDGQALAKDFEVVQGPPNFDSAPRYKSPALGLTVRDLTYEVRRYFQKGPEEPGVIVSKVEPGSKASVAGVKPYEIITHVNDKPIAGVKDFEAVTQGQDELRLSVKRLTRGRVVKIRTTGAAATETTDRKPAAPAEPGGPSGKKSDPPRKKPPAAENAVP